MSDSVAQIPHIINRSAIADESSEALFTRLESARIAYEANPPGERERCCNDGGG